MLCSHLLQILRIEAILSLPIQIVICILLQQPDPQEVFLMKSNER